MLTHEMLSCYRCFQALILIIVGGASMTFEIKRNPRVLAGEILEKLGAVDLTQCDCGIGSSAYTVQTIYGAIRGALEQIRFGKISAMHVGMLDVTKELSDALASIQET